ncbi:MULTISPECIES: MFS transporter [Alphaproteobacteria]|uniref:MFS transporter n=2 Tax=Alphaproteobacteria TaxID=28211 RepID=A0A512HFE2_9HYPH|nr:MULTISPECIES: MFS transporter [Alphaproteobacteria]GEO84158.1 MFS transporter [Ciceribacter naphthalenivorans]GLR24694.1 MFS transporter [Ciceribacter naphthalenivorans]GLT07550.1 MFS transporter [Sphingomonas psychrolutea]
MESKTETTTGTDTLVANALDRTAEAPASGRWIELLAPRYLATTTMLCMGVALYAFNGFLVSTVLPTAVGEIGGAELLSWSMTLYLVASIVAGASAALLKQRYGARTVLFTAALIFLVGTLAAAFATDMNTVLFGRICQGIGEGIIAAICYALIPEMFPPALVPKVFGAEASVWAVAAFGGPVLAGSLTEAFSWRVAFLVNVPLIALFLLLALVLVPAGAEIGRRVQFPTLRLTLLSLGLVSMLVAGLAGPISLTVAMVAGSLLMVLGAVRLDRRAQDSILPQGAFSTRSPLGLGLWVILLMPLSQATSSVYLVYSLQYLFGYRPTLAGALGALMAISWSITANGVANLRTERSRQVAIWLGPMLLVLGFASLAGAIGTMNIIMLAIAQIIIGAAFGLSWGYLSQMLMEVTPDHERDKTSAILPTLQSAGFALGAALAGLNANGAGLATAQSVDTMRSVLTFTFAIALVWAIPAFLAARRAVRLMV